jgi:predicted small lipoprotein YifL
MRWIFASCIIVLALTGCGKKAPSLEFWPYDAVRQTDSDYFVDGDEQLEALQKANPEADAELAFVRGDFRLVAEKFFGVFLGVPDDKVTNYLVKNYKFKVLGFTDDLRSNTEFQKLRQNYLERYNKKLHSLVAAARFEGR